MRTIKGLTDTISGIIITQKDNCEPHKIAENIIEMLFKEDNLVLPPKEDYDLRLKLFDNFFDWHKNMGFISFKREDFKEYLNQL